MKIFEIWKKRAADLKVNIYTIYMAYRDPRVPWYTKILAMCVIGYTFSPIDLIPDFIPVLGYLDDLVLIPLGIILVLKLLPKEIYDEYREKAQDMMIRGKPVNWVAAVFIVLIWLFAAAFIVYYVM